MAKSNEAYTQEEQERIMQSIAIIKANAFPKSAKVLAGQDHGCKNGLVDTATSITAVKMSG